MSVDYKLTIYNAIFDARAAVQTSFLRATFTGSLSSASSPWTKVVLRPVRVKGQEYVQFSYYDDKKCITKNYRDEALVQHLNELLELPFRNIHVSSALEEIHITVSREGKTTLHRSKPVPSATRLDLSHNRQKDFLIPEGKPDAYLQAIGFMTQEGQIKADKQRKFKQINEFLKLIQQTGELEKFRADPLKESLSVVDFGCGNAYLTFAVYHYLNDILHLPACMVGVDVRGELLEKHARTVESLGWRHLTFDQTRIADYMPSAPPDITLALHACDTATDEAIAQGINWKSALIISVPCCHHHLQEQLSHTSIPEAFRLITRHGILSERLGDLLTDAFRASILRIMGYQTDVIQFISAEHTARNVMIRSVRSDASVPLQFVREYTSMKAFWGVTPYLEPLLGDAFSGRLASASGPLATDER